jgi:hypothetical protein
MVTKFDRSKSLQELENSNWGEPTYQSGLVVTCHRLRRKPLSDFTPADLRVMIGQSIGLRFLMPLAIEKLELNPFAETSLYPGDLLSVVLKVGHHFWDSNVDLFHRMSDVFVRVKSLLPTLDTVEGPSIETAIKGASPAFRDLLM